MKSAPYLIDSNILIQAKNEFYAFDLVPSFWDKMEHLIEGGLVAILDKVAHEINQGTDQLTNWFNNLNVASFFNSHDQDIFIKSAEVLQSLKNDPRYKQKAFEEWAENEEVADPWLIGCAAVYGLTIVTFEPYVNINETNPSKTAKIPNLAELFGVRTINLFEMLREQKIVL